MRKPTHSELVDKAAAWLKSYNWTPIKDLRTMNTETPDVIGFRSGESLLIECKVSRSDFRAEKKKFFRLHSEFGMGKFRFYLCPSELIKIEDLPKDWGLMWVKDNGKIKMIHNPYGKGNIWGGGIKRNIEAEMAVMYSVLRRLNLSGHLDEIYK